MALHWCYPTPPSHLHFSGAEAQEGPVRGALMSVIHPFYSAWPMEGYPLPLPPPPHTARCCLWLAPVSCSRLWGGACPETAVSSLRHREQHGLMEPVVWYLLYPSLLPRVTWPDPPSLVVTVRLI